MEAGVRLPQDVRIATWANRGNAPVCPVGLNLLLADADAYGKAIADRVLQTLRGETVRATLEFPMSYLKGEST